MKWIKDNTAWIALVVLGALGVWLYLDLKKPVKEPGEMPKVEELAGVKAADVIRLELKKGGPPIVLAKSGAEWRMESPVKAKADAEEVNRIIQGLLGGASDFILEAPKDLKQYRLDPPEFELTLTGKSGEKNTLQFGMQDPAKASVYTRDADSGKVFLTSSGSVDTLRNKDQNALRDKTLVAAASNKINGITIEKPAGVIRLVKGEKDRWQLTQPWTAPADVFSVSGMTSALGGLKGDRFIAADVKDLTKYGLANPQFTVTAESEGAKAAVRIGKKTSDRMEYYAAPVGADNVLTITEANFQALNKTAKELRSRKIVDFENVDVQRFAVTGPKGSWEVEKAGEEWKFVKPNPGQKAKAQTIENLLMDLTTQAASLVEQESPVVGKYGLDKPLLTATVFLKDQGRQQLKVGNKLPKGANYYASGTPSPNTVFELGGYIFDNLNKKPEDLK